MNKRFGTLVFIAAMGISSVGFADSSSQYYSSEIRAKIASAAYYPNIAIGRGTEGVVGVAVTIGDGGSVKDAVIENSSGVTALDNAAITAVRAAAPFAWPPTGVAVVHTKIKYVLEN